jgi:hypothetical protein
VRGENREDFVVGVDRTWLKDEVALLIDLVLALLVIPARLLECDVVLGGALPEPSCDLPGFLGA